YVATHRVLVRSPLIVSRAINDHGLRALASFQNIDEDLTDLMIKKLTVRRGSKDASNTSQNSILSLSFRGTVANECAVVVNAVVNSYKDFLDETYRNMSDDTLKLIGDARDTLTKDLAEQEREYRLFRERSPILFKGRDEVNPRHDVLVRIEAQRSA